MSTTLFKFHANSLYFFRLNLAYYRNAKGWTQEQLAEKAGISPGYLAHLEALRSDAEPSFETLSRLACALGVTISELTAVDLELIR